MGLFILLLLALAGLTLYLAKLRHTALTVSLLSIPEKEGEGQLATVSVIIPAYNEADNIEGCVTSVLNSTSLSPETLEVWVVDDQSSDDTLEIVQSLQSRLQDPRLHLLPGAPRPENEVWMGKNWACCQGAEKAKGAFLLFLDADVRLKPGAIEAVIPLVAREKTDLFTCSPQIRCECLAEWLVQPLMAGMLAVGFDFQEVSDPNSPTAFAVGQFMLFSRTAYDQLGGHRAVANQVVEDVELARQVKGKGMKLTYAPGNHLATVRMYPSLAALWEGWTKNWHLGSRRNLSLTLQSAAIVFLVCTVPWIGLGFAGIKIAMGGGTILDFLVGGTALIAIALQYWLRRIIAQITGISTRYWWLMGVGGGLASAIAIASIIKTETGWGWTWRGRALKLPPGVG